jgi:TniQ
MFEAQLPITLMAQEDESALGYVLRSLHVNGVNMHWLRRAIGLPELHKLTRPHARTLAWILGCSEPWLAAGLRTKKIREGLSIYEWQACELMCANHLRRQNPQICPQCVHQFGYCRQLWELAVATHCSQHHSRLIDVCGYCHTRLRWERPSVDVCHCGHPFKLEAEDERAVAPNLELMRVLQSLLQDACLTGIELASSVSPVLMEMSLPGVLTLVNAFGILRHVHEIIQPSQRIKSLRTHEWDDIVQRAGPRLELFCRDPRDVALHGVVDSVLIMHLLGKSNHPVDHQVAMLACATLPRDRQPNIHSYAFQRTLF